MVFDMAKKEIVSRQFWWLLVVGRLVLSCAWSPGGVFDKLRRGLGARGGSPFCPCECGPLATAWVVHTPALNSEVNEARLALQRANQGAADDTEYAAFCPSPVQTITF